MEDDCPLVLDEVAAAGVVAGGEGVASLSTLLALLLRKQNKILKHTVIILIC